MNIERPTKAKIIKRYKRFLADVFINDELHTVYVPNTGSMKSCWQEGWPVILSFKDDPKRKHKFTLEMLHNDQSWIGVNTSRANKIVSEALKNKKIKELQHISDFKAEVKIGNSRIDFLLNEETNHYLEVKNVSLKIDNYCTFPDSVSVRGQKHLKELMTRVDEGEKASLLFLVQRQDVKFFHAKNDIDPTYSELLIKAHQKGVQILAYQCKLTENDISLDQSLPIKFN